MRSFQSILEGIFDDVSSERIEDVATEIQLSEILSKLVLRDYDKIENIGFKVQKDTLIITLKTCFANLNKSVQEALKPFGIKNIIYKFSPTPRAGQCGVEIKTLKDMNIKVDKGEKILLFLRKNPFLTNVNIEVEYMDFGDRYSIKNSNIKNKYAAFMPGFSPSSRRKVSGGDIKIDYAYYEGVYLYEGRFDLDINSETCQANNKHNWDPTELAPGIEPNVIVFPLHKDKTVYDETPVAVFRKESGGMFNNKYNLYFVRADEFHKETNNVFKQYAMASPFYRGM